MAIRDIEAFMRERAQLYDGNMDVAPGSPFDVQVIQPLLRRLGTDPFTVDLTTFIADRMVQAFPDIANQDDDAITDLLNKPVTLLWDPIVREVGRVRKNLSFADPTQMTTDEADALGANFFNARKRGQFAKGPGRILFQNPQNISISPANFFTSKGGLHFFPTETQSIRLEEMLLNVTTDGLYYFDVNLIAEAAGSSYNIEPDSLISVANVSSATRVTNIRRFTLGEQEESAQEYISRSQQELSERSLVTLRGIAAKLVGNFPEVNRLNVVGAGDEEMQRDVLRGGGLGVVRAFGTTGSVLADGEGAATSRRFYAAGAGFLTLFGQTGAVTGWVLTAFDAFGTAAVMLELTVRGVVDDDTLDVEEQVLVIGTSAIRWTLRRRELTLSSIPGGLLFPNSPDGTLTLPDDEVHVGGMYDTYVRGSALSEETFVIDSLTDDEPLLSGVAAVRTTVGLVDGFALAELGISPFSDELEAELDEAVRFGYTLQVQEGVNAGNYRVVAHGLTGASELFLEVDPVPVTPDTTPCRWRLFDVINVDLLNPRETRVTGTDLVTVQNSDVVSVPAGTDFITLGVSEGDALEIMAGASKGVYAVLETPVIPTDVRVDKVLEHTAANLSYRIYRANTGGQLAPPFVRVTKVELLDSSRQPVGTEIPYARPVDVQTRAFQNPARGVKHDLRNARLGLVTRAAAPTFGYVAGQTLTVHVEGLSPAERTLVLAETSPTVDDALDDLNAQFLAVFGLPEVVVKLGTDRLGIRPVGAQGYVAVTGGTACSALFGTSAELYTSGDVRSDDVANWGALTPPIDFTLSLDVLQVLDGSSVGFYASPFRHSYLNTAKFPNASTPSSALLVGGFGDNDVVDYIPRVTFAPEQRRRVQVGARSLGSVRVYFLAPTSFEVDSTAVFTLATDTGELRFIPDPNLDHQRIPPLPANDIPQDGKGTYGASVWHSSSQDFVLAGVQAGDKLVVEVLPLEGTVALTDPISNLAGKSLVFSLDEGENRSVVFIRDNASLPTDSVSRAGMLEQLNAAFGEDIASLSEADDTLRLVTTKKLAIRRSGTANGLLLGTLAGTSPPEDFTAVDVTNESPFAGTYTIAAVAPQDLTTTDPFPDSYPYAAPTVTSQSFKVLRTGVQRISATEMAENQAEAGLYYFDVELISEGTGDQYNISSGLQLMPAGYRSDGYYLTTDDENLTFSELERPKLVISRTVLERGVDDSPVNATQLTGENIQVTYARSQLVSDIQNYIAAETERVVCSNPLSRHLIPMFIRLDLNYQGGSGEAVVLEDVVGYINDLAPVDTLDASDVQKLLSDRGANYVQNPLDLIGVVYGVDRSVWASRSQNQLTAGRLTAFIPEVITVKRKVT
jgi:hypothetical protein